MKICLLTYDQPHLKTAQVYLGLRNKQRYTIDFLVCPFVKRPSRQVMFEHRPNQFEGCGVEALSRMDGRIIHPYSSWKNILSMYEYFIVCGSNLIEPEFARSKRVLNVHSGLIPNTRGLDSFKWAILRKQLLGNTLHLIDEEVDNGEVIAQIKTPVFYEDDISTLARRHYEQEIWMLQNFEELLQKRTVMNLPRLDPTKRMNLTTEAEMLRSFEDFKYTFAS